MHRIEANAENGENMDDFVNDKTMCISFTYEYLVCRLCITSKYNIKLISMDLCNCSCATILFILLIGDL